ncbi:MAG: TraR/DksA family transcriptional regulator [Ktedonobacterales bacterium]
MNNELTPQILAELKARLEEKRSQLQSDLASLQSDDRGGIAQGTTSKADEVHDTGEEVADLEQLERDNDVEDDLRDQLREVEHALAKFATGTYGLCEVCGRPIPLARLRAIPEARYDAEHQAEVEAEAAGRAGS